MRQKAKSPSPALAMGLFPKIMKALLGSSFSSQRQTGRLATTHTHVLAHQLHISKIYAVGQTVKKLLEGYTGKLRCQNESLVKALTSTFFLPSGVLAGSGTIRSSSRAPTVQTQRRIGNYILIIPE
ncbi:MAG TPA: hypothetical protein VFB76_06065 [Candidatus Angelobacter sp.]|nr:hypothetical protein [Candidatus Angelobacter sp.]